MKRSTRSLTGICICMFAAVSLNVCAKYSELISWQIGVKQKQIALNMSEAK